MQISNCTPYIILSVSLWGAIARSETNIVVVGQA